MPKKYRIPVEVAPPRFHPVGKYATAQFREDCAGSCRDCVRNRCIYEIHRQNSAHISSMKEPEYLYNCKSCLRCIQECIKGTFSLTVNPEYLTLGDDYWTPEIIATTWTQAEKGQVPVSGAGYRGPFVGKGFDSMWTDMSEIVRPTRDGIHGREYINTSVELSRRPARLQFNDMSLVTAVPPILEVPIPVLFQPQGFVPLSNNVLQAMALAASKLNTLMFIKPEDHTDALEPYADNIIPCFSADNYGSHVDLIRRSRMVELAYRPGIEEEFARMRSWQPELAIAVGIPLNGGAANLALQIARTEVDAIHFYADSRGNELDTAEPRFLKEMIREIHLILADNSVRTKVNLIFSGGIALAEHMAKAIICGADAVAIDQPLLIALECRSCRRCEEGKLCPVKLDEIDLRWGNQRILNLMSAWRNQLIEVMGAMGIREVRRLRGEVGRSMWFEDLEREVFGAIFGERKGQGVI